MDLWTYISGQLSVGGKLVMMCVLDSRGSSPGRQGFKMAVSDDGTMSGSIGGGIMEHKMVELCRSLLKTGNSFKPFIKHQVHRNNVSDKSGMICSGEQIISFYNIQKNDLLWVEALLRSLNKNKKGVLRLNDVGINYFVDEILEDIFSFSIKSEKVWDYKEQPGFKNTIYIVGGGHVGLALSAIMKDLGFYVVIIDDREALNTMIDNSHAHQTKIVNYHEIDTYIPEGDASYVVILSFGYRTDKIILKQLINKKYKYIGMMGSAEKVKKLYQGLMEDGITKELLSTVYAPIGMTISSKTPAEIAVSIAAEIIQVKNSRK